MKQKIKKENKEKILEIINKANSEEYKTEWIEGVPIPKKKSKIKSGRLAKASGARFELKVREDLESKGWIVSKWQNQVEFEEEEIG